MAEEHKQGSMDISEQERMFGAFVTWVAWGSLIIIVALILLAIING